MKTRDRILDAALTLFNQEGFVNISTNRIATELDISPGNLYYHFKSKQSLIEWLFRRLEHEIAPFTDSRSSLAALDDVWLTLHLTFETIEKYRFVYLDIDHLSREYPKIGERLRAMTAGAIEMMRAICRNMAHAGVIGAESEHIDSLAFHIVLTATCWCPFVRLTPFKHARATGSGVAAYHVLTLLQPYLVGEARHYMSYLRGKYLR
jgi:AcrR family transcriptional regulator